MAERRVDLNVPFVEKDLAKQLGARWDGRTWYVPPGVALDAFERWLSADLSGDPSNADDSQAKVTTLAVLLAQVQAVVWRQLYHRQWITAEITELRAKAGHVYLTLAEHDVAGQLLARCRASIWKNTAAWLLEKFATATGGRLQADMKVMFLVSVEFHVLHGFNLVVEDIDPSYTLGDLAARLAQIREKLLDLGLYANNKALTMPVEFTQVAVIAPLGAAGLGDFRREADLLERYGLCQFHYYDATFQGAQAAKEITAVVRRIFDPPCKQIYDVLVIIRGGGAVTDLAWLNDFSLAQAICCCAIPVFSGIGHQRDNTILDEVANRRFDTPSKLIAHIFACIKDNALQAQTDIRSIQLMGLQMLGRGTQHCKDQFRVLEDCVVQGFNTLQKVIERHWEFCRTSATHQVEMVNKALLYQCVLRRDTMRFMVDNIGIVLRESLRVVHHDMDRQLRHRQDEVLPLYRQIQADVAQVSTYYLYSVQQIYQQFGDQARFQWSIGRQECTSMMKNLIGLGPEQTLRRGYVLVRNPQGNNLTRRRQVSKGQMIILHFSDGAIRGRIDD